MTARSRVARELWERTILTPVSLLTWIQILSNLSRYPETIFRTQVLAAMVWESSQAPIYSDTNDSRVLWGGVLQFCELPVQNSEDWEPQLISRGLPGAGTDLNTFSLNPRWTISVLGDGARQTPEENETVRVPLYPDINKNTRRTSF